MSCRASISDAFLAALLDDRFSVLADGVFVQYPAVTGIDAGLIVTIDPVELGGEAVPSLKYEPIACGSVFVASLPDLWRMKARAYAITRPGEKVRDLDDCKWLMRQMVKEKVDYDPVELLEMLLGEAGARSVSAAVTENGLEPNARNELTSATPWFHTGANELSSPTTLTMAGNLDDDEYIASLLKQDAQTAKKKYELVGLDAFNPKRVKSGAPKPNTNFLRHIIRQTDSHNSALLAREAEESNARLRRMNQERIRVQKKDDIRKERKADGRLTPVMSDEDDTHSRSQRRADNKQRKGRHEYERSHRDRSADSHDRKRRSRSRSRDDGRVKRKRRHSHERPSQRSRHAERDREEDRRRNHHSDSDSEDSRSHGKRRSSHRHKRRRSRSRSSSLSADRSDKKRRQRDRSRDHKHKERRASHKSRRRSPSLASDSDPLEAIVGPLPPNIEPSVRSRGRGAHKANSMGMDSRFSSAYDPSMDVRQASDVEDKWDDAVESFRDRQRFKQQGAERLRAAGFTDEQVKKWEKGDSKDEEDVTWTKRGQAREWDRGKVVDEDGDVELKADWGRLK